MHAHAHAHAHGHAHWRGFGGSGDWQDRVADKEEPLERDFDFDAFVAEAVEAAQTAVECVVEPLAAFVGGLPDAFDAGPRERRRWRRRARAWARGWRWRD